MKKGLIAIVVSIAIMLFGSVYAYTDEEKQNFTSELELKIDEAISNGGYKRLVIDKTFNIKNIEFGTPHKVYDFNTAEVEPTLKFNNQYVVKVGYNDKEIADIYYKINDGYIYNIVVALNYADIANDVILDDVYDAYRQLDEKEYICIYHDYNSSELPTLAFLLNDNKMTVISDKDGIFNEYLYSGDYSKYIEKDSFSKILLNQKNRTSTNDMLKVLFIISIIGLVLNLFILYAHSIDRISTKKNNKKEMVKQAKPLKK